LVIITIDVKCHFSTSIITITSGGARKIIKPGQKFKDCPGSCHQIIEIIKLGQKFSYGRAIKFSRKKNLHPKKYAI